MHTHRLSKEDITSQKHLDALIKNGRFRVAIFGSARVSPEHETYRAVRDLSHMIATAGYDIVTGGGPGVMEAASLGHHEACEAFSDHSSAVGINIALPYEQKPNPFLDITSTKATFSERLDTFVLLSHVFVVASGGIGTLLELFYAWQLMQVHHICRTPIILWGPQYTLLRDFIEREIVAPGYASPADLDLIIPVDTLDQAWELVQMAEHSFRQAGDAACVNIQYYRAAAEKLGFV